MTTVSIAYEVTAKAAKLLDGLAEEGDELEMEIEADYYPGKAARITGRIETSFPPEPMEIDITEVKVLVGDQWMDVSEIIEKEYDSLEQSFLVEIDKLEEDSRW